MTFASRVSRDLRRAGIVTLPSGTPITTEGVRVRRSVIARERAATVTIDGVPGRGLRIVADAVVDALAAAGYETAVSDIYAADGIISVDVSETTS